ncbi:hypothetical protein IT774_01805 [Salinimonas marina]|uniref:Uncharacterized protein n=1 Tax=Salinimonas marina TaxID=2785918 RepID=A0A7S9HDW9_9ALTE|nr:hypothetical protein [Salinimonas marina]QPG06016.1 hypothetical protein IT774_01805 [Salinimonas marina]
MNTSSESYTKRANKLFASGKYEEAQAAYEHAGVKLGMHLVKASIWLCEKRQAETNNETEQAQMIPPLPVSADIDKSALEAQLTQTQALVEKYYTELQNLRFEKMDSEKK